MSGTSGPSEVRMADFTSREVEGEGSGDGRTLIKPEESKGNKIMSIDPERNDAIEKARPGEAVFKAIFGSDSEDD